MEIAEFLRAIAVLENLVRFDGLVYKSFELVESDRGTLVMPVYSVNAKKDKKILEALNKVRGAVYSDE